MPLGYSSWRAVTAAFREADVASRIRRLPEMAISPEGAGISRKVSITLDGGSRGSSWAMLSAASPRREA